MICLMSIYSITGMSSVKGAGGNFNAGKSVAESLRSSISGNIMSGGQKSLIPQFKEGFSISETETTRTMEHAGKNEAARTVFEIHKDRGMYKFDENDPLFERSEGIEKEPEKALHEAEEIEAGGEGYTIEYCEECSDEEYIVKARKTKKRYVYLSKPPYIETKGARCDHGILKIIIRIQEEKDEMFREDGQFNIVHTTTTKGTKERGDLANTYEHFLVNGCPLVLVKTVYQNGRPWPNRGNECCMTRDLHRFVINSPDLVKQLLGGSEDAEYNWGRIGIGHLYHRVINDTGEHYWYEDDKCKEYERLCDAGLCRYVSMVEDPQTDKYWKGKRIRGSWGQTVTYACKYDDGTSNCKKLRLRGGEQIGSECIKEIAGKCVKWRQKYRCRDRVRSKGYRFSGETAFCLDGNCIDTSFKSDEDMIEALGYLSILEHVRKELDGTNNINIFKGIAKTCTRWILSFKDCCVRHGWGMDIGLASCDRDSKELAEQRNEGKCVRIGSYCAEKLPLLGTCVRKKTVFCCFGSKFAKLLQEQGKRQLGIGFGAAEAPNCRGFTAEELRRIDFSKLDLSEIAEDVMKSFKPQDLKKHLAKGEELEKIRASMKDLPMMRQAEREGDIINENIKHMTGSIGVRK